jgi:hypothetical protein
MPIQRFGSMLVSKGQFNSYMQLLRGAHRDENIEHVMCRNLLSIDWQGYLYDCDFNQQLGLPIITTGHVLACTSPRCSAAALDGLADPGGRPLLRLHGGPGVELRGRAGVKEVAGGT